MADTYRNYFAAICAGFKLNISKTEALIDYFGDECKAYEAAYEALAATGLFTKSRLERIIAERDRNLPSKLAAFCKRENARIVTYRDKEYPLPLRSILNPPKVLYVKGSMIRDGNLIGIVGSRKASAYGLKAARLFAKDLSAAGISIVSGGARGIDTAAHCGALEGTAPTVAVFGCGLDIAYPHENERLFAKIAEHGAIITEFLPGTKPFPNNFPARNRIISGLVKGVLVVEAAKKGGAMITAEFALDEGREVYCLPGSIFSPTSAGPNALIKQGARLVDRPEDILEDFQLFLPKSKEEMNDGIGLFDKVMTANRTEVKAIIDNLDFNEAKTVEEIVESTGLPPGVAASALLELKLAGAVMEQAGRRFLKQ